MFGEVGHGTVAYTTAQDVVVMFDMISISMTCAFGFVTLYPNTKCKGGRWNFVNR